MKFVCVGNGVVKDTIGASHRKGRVEDADLARVIKDNQKPLTPLAEKILTAIKEEKELTYAEAYAALELARKRLELESKFVFVGNG